MIKSETFYQAECDASGCERRFPGENDDEGASHYPLDDLKRYMAEERGEFDETWTETPDGRTYCAQHKPGNIDCTTCGGRGFVASNPEGETYAERDWHTCESCNGRGYLSPAVDSEARL